jgi:hypothetical protein
MSDPSNGRIQQTDDDQKPCRLRQKQMHDLQPNRGKKEHVRRARGKLNGQQAARHRQAPLRRGECNDLPASIDP